MQKNDGDEAGGVLNWQSPDRRTGAGDPDWGVFPDYKV
jgi:hypothetical protein